MGSYLWGDKPSQATRDCGGLSSGRTPRGCPFDSRRWRRLRADSRGTPFVRRLRIYAGAQQPSRGPSRANRAEGVERPGSTPHRRPSARPASLRNPHNQTTGYYGGRGMNLENEQESIEAERLMMRILQVSFDSSCPRVGVIALIAALASFPT